MAAVVCSGLGVPISVISSLSYVILVKNNCWTPNYNTSLQYKVRLDFKILRAWLF